MTTVKGSQDLEILHQDSSLEICEGAKKQPKKVINKLIYLDPHLNSIVSFLAHEQINQQKGGKDK